MNLFNFLTYFVIPALSLSSILVFYRFVKGPNAVDRIVALELLISIGIASIAVFSMTSNQLVLLDVSMILALIAFLGTVGYSYYMEKKGK